MPLLKYFGVAGTALLLILFGLNWLAPQSAEGPIRTGVDRTVIRISSIERLPDAVVIDTSLPTISPPPVVPQPLEQPPQLTLAETNRGSLVRNENVPLPKKQKPVVPKRKPAKTSAAQRTASTVYDPTALFRSVEAAIPATRMSLLDVLKERLGHTSFKLN